MSLRKLSAIALCAAAIGLPAFAARQPDPNSLDEVIKQVQEQQKKTMTIESDFRQEKILSLLARPEVSTGRFVFSKPDKVLWIYDAPRRVEMLISNGIMTTYYPDLNKAEQLEVKRYQDRIFKYMGASGAIDDLAIYFDFTFTNRADDPRYVLDLKPKTKSIAKRVQHIVFAELRNLLDGFAFDHLRQHGCRRLADGASAPLEAHLRHHVALDLQVNSELIAAQGIGVLGVRVRMLQFAIVARIAEMIQYIFTIIH